MSLTTKGDYLTRIFEVVVGRPCTYAMHRSIDVQRCGDEILRALEASVVAPEPPDWIYPGVFVDVALGAKYDGDTQPSVAAGWAKAKVLTLPGGWGDVELTRRDGSMWADGHIWAHWKYLTPTEAKS